MGWEPISVSSVIALLTVLGGGVAWVYDRWSKRTDQRETRMIELWKMRAEDAQKARAEAEAEADQARQDASRWRRMAISWHSQLLKNDIDPDPPMSEEAL